MTRITGEWLTHPAATKVCAVLADAGHHALFVGGCVRNALLGAPVTDYDISTDAKPDRVMDLAKKAGLNAIPTGYDHGTVTVVSDGIPFEITTFRRDVATDGRRAVVAYTDTVEDDARRRDFTMNALYARADGTIVDPLGGLSDLQARHVRFIEDPAKRIAEDYLRILRFFRFTAWYGDPTLGFDVDGLAACVDGADGLQSLSNERVTQEVLKLLSAPDPAPAVATMAQSGVLWRILPGATAGGMAVLVHLEGELQIPPDPIRRLAVLGGAPADDLRLPNAARAKLENIKSGREPIEISYHYGFAVGRDALLCDASLLGEQPLVSDIEKLRWAAEQVFPVKAADLMPGLQGPALGAALKQAEARWIASGFTLTKDDLLG